MFGVLYRFKGGGGGTHETIAEQGGGEGDIFSFPLPVVKCVPSRTVKQFFCPSVFLFPMENALKTRCFFAVIFGGDVINQQKKKSIYFISYFAAVQM